MKLEAENSALQTSENELTELISHLRIKLTTSNEELRRSKHVENSQSVTADKVWEKKEFIEYSANLGISCHNIVFSYENSYSDRSLPLGNATGSPYEFVTVDGSLYTKYKLSFSFSKWKAFRKFDQRL